MKTDRITLGKRVQGQTFEVGEVWCLWSVLHFISGFQVRNRCLGVANANSSHKIILYVFRLSVPYNILDLVSLDVGSRSCTSKHCFCL